MSLHRRSDGSGPGERIGSPSGTHEVRRASRSAPVAVGTLACQSCDAPVAPSARLLAVAEPLACSFCARAGTVRDFLKLGLPTRPTRVAVRVLSGGARRR